MTSSNEAPIHELEEELHDLCQPLTALHCHLELGKFSGDQETLREAVDAALKETARMIASIKRMRERVTTMKAAGRPQEKRRSMHDSLRPDSETTERGARN